MTDTDLISILEKRFNENNSRHIEIEWDNILKRLETEFIRSHFILISIFLFENTLAITTRFDKVSQIIRMEK